MSRLIFLLAITSATLLQSSCSDPPLVDDQDPPGLSALPASNNHDQESASQSLTLGQKISLNHLGPAIVNEDGTLRRIANWDLLTPQEQAVAFRRISERNKQREALKSNQGLQQDPSLSADTEKTSNSTGLDVYAFQASDLVLLALLAAVLIFILPAKIYRMLRRLTARSTKPSKSN